MINSPLTVINLKAGSVVEAQTGDIFVLKTCQRTLVLGFAEAPFYHIGEKALREDNITDVFSGDDAYTFLLETICGLRSEIIAEYEVVSQFKEAYNDYAKNPARNTALLNVLEKLFQDNKKIRTEHLTEIGQMSYAGITRKLIHKRFTGGNVLITGSGTLAEDLIKLLKKKYNIFLTARNTERVEQLKEQYGILVLPWEELATYTQFPFIVNTIGSKEILFDNYFFNRFFEDNSLAYTASQQMKLFIDLGSPSVIKTNLTEEQGVLRLEDIFRQSAKLNSEKMEKVKKAKESIFSLASHRSQTFKSSSSFVWEELSFG